jgi:hypothetical protein
MNRNEFENWMKNTLEEQQFTPSESEWEKLHLKLEPPKHSGNKALLFVPWLKLAASVLIIISVGILGYSLITPKNKETVHLSIQNKAANSKTEPTLMDETAPKNINQAQTATTVPQKRVSTNRLKQIMPDSIIAVAKKSSLNVNTTKQSYDLSHALQKEEQHTAQKSNIAPLGNPYAYQNNQYNRNLILSVAANVGKPSVGIIQYQVGMTTRKNLSEKFYTEATVAVSSTSVDYKQQQDFNSIKVGFAATSSENVSIEKHYAQNIISLGVSPVLGIRINSKLSIATGGSIARNLNTTLDLQNKSQVDNAALDNAIVNTTQQINSWDLGLLANIDYQINKNISLNARYKQGLSTYLYYDNKSYRNSGFSFGLRCLLYK